MSDLKPCPFCGESAAYAVRRSQGWNYVHVYCENEECWAEIGEEEWSDTYRSSEEAHCGAREIWNNRVDDRGMDERGGEALRLLSETVEAMRVLAEIVSHDPYCYELECHFCSTSPHEPDCPWLQAKKLVEEAAQCS